MRDLVDLDGVHCEIDGGDGAKTLVRRFADVSGSAATLAECDLAGRAQLAALELPVLAAPEIVRERGSVAHRYLVPAGAERLDALLTRAPHRAREIAVAVAQWLRRLHDRQLVMMRAFAWNLLVKDDLGVVPIELYAVRRKRRFASDHLRDVAALFASLDLAMLSTSSRGRLLAAYASSREVARACASDVRRKARALRAAGVMPRLYPTIAACKAREFFFHAHERLAPLLFGQTSTWPLAGQPLAAWVSEERLRDRGTYENVRATVTVADDRYGLYLKRHRQNNGEARTEWLNHLRVARLGIACPVPALIAEGPKSEVFATFAVEGSVPLDRALVDRHPALDRRRLARELGYIVRRLHLAGLSHRDLYLGHFHVQGERLVLLDLARVEEWARLPRRLRVKDLASLYYSARAVSASHTEVARFLRTYLSGGRLRVHRSLLNSVRVKRKRIERHAGPALVSPRP